MKTVCCLLPFACCLLVTSCYTPRYIYSPAAHNIPLLEKKGDSKIAINYSAAGNIGRNGKANGYDLQSAYAFSNHWAAQLNYVNRTEINAGDFGTGSRDSVVINYKRNMTELGAGYFHALKNNQRALLQIFAGVGVGKTKFTDKGRDQNGLYRNRSYTMDVTKIFIQPAITVKGKKNFAASMSSRFSLLFFKNIQTDYTANELDNYNLDSLTYTPRLFWEPAIINTFGIKSLPGLQFEFQAGFAFLTSRKFIDARAFNFSAGLLFDLPKLFAFTTHSSKN